MKKQTIKIAICCITLFFLTGSIHAQYVSADITNHQIENGNYTLEGSDPEEDALVNNILPRAVRNFTKSFKKAEYVKWHQLKSGSAASFILDGVRTRVVYDAKGDEVYLLKCYAGDQLPADIRAWVKGTWYDCIITAVDEIRQNGNPYYFVHLEDKTTIKMLRISSNDEIETGIIKEINKA